MNFLGCNVRSYGTLHINNKYHLGCTIVRAVTIVNRLHTYLDRLAVLRHSSSTVCTGRFGELPSPSATGDGTSAVFLYKKFAEMRDARISIFHNVHIYYANYFKLFIPACRSSSQSWTQRRREGFWRPGRRLLFGAPKKFVPNSPKFAKSHELFTKFGYLKTN